MLYMDDSRDQQRAERLLVGWMPVALMPIEQRPVGGKGISCSSTELTRSVRTVRPAQSPWRYRASIATCVPGRFTGTGYRCSIGTVPVKRHRGSRDSTGKKTPGGAGTHTGHSGHTGTDGHTDHTDEPHNHPNPMTHPHDHATAERRGRLNSRSAQAKSRPLPAADSRPVDRGSMLLQQSLPESY